MLACVRRKGRTGRIARVCTCFGGIFCLFELIAAPFEKATKHFLPHPGMLFIPPYRLVDCEFPYLHTNHPPIPSNVRQVSVTTIADGLNARSFPNEVDLLIGFFCIALSPAISLA